MNGSTTPGVGGFIFHVPPKFSLQLPFPAWNTKEPVDAARPATGGERVVNLLPGKYTFESPV